MKESEYTLAEQLINQTGDNILILLDKGYYSLGLLNAWNLAGKQRHSMSPLRKGALGEEMTVRLLSVTRKGKVCHLLTSMTDALRCPRGEMVDLYNHRWGIELGYREIKQTMQLSRLTVRSKKPKLMEQERWGVLLAYNLGRYHMIKMLAA